MANISRLNSYRDEAAQEIAFITAPTQTGAQQFQPGDVLQLNGNNEAVQGFATNVTYTGAVIAGMAQGSYADYNNTQYPYVSCVRPLPTTLFEFPAVNSGNTNGVCTGMTAWIGQKYNLINFSLTGATQGITCVDVNSSANALVEVVGFGGNPFGDMAGGGYAGGLYPTPGTDPTASDINPAVWVKFIGIGNTAGQNLI